MAQKTILVVDDDQEVLAYLKRLLSSDGWRVLTETDGQWAIKTFKSRRVDAVILDILLPVVGGFQVADSIRSHPQGVRVPILMLSGIYRGASQRAEAVQRYGLLDYLNKPVEGERIRKLLREHFGDRYPTPAVRRPSPSTRLESARLVDGEARAEKKLVEEQARALALEKVMLRGNLKTTPFPRLVHELYRLKSTGALFLLRDKVKKIVYLRNGRPVHVKSNLLKECLGQLLVREKVITEAQCEQSLARMKKSKNLQGRELVTMGLLSESDLKLALVRQLRAKLLHVFGWAEGEYQFKESAKLPAADASLDMTPATLIWEGVRRAQSTEQLRDRLASTLSAYMAPAADPELRFQKMDLGAEEMRFLEAVDGSRTVRDLFSGASLPEQRSLALAYALISAGMVELWDRPVALPPLQLPSRLGPEGSAPCALSADEALVALESELPILKSMDHFQLLGIDREADPMELEQAFAARARFYHPDWYLHLNRSCRDLAESIFGLFREAYQVLRNPGRRQAYEAELDGRRGGKNGRSSVSTQVSDPQLSSLAAARYLEEGKERLAMGLCDEAAWSFRKAVELDPDEGIFYAYLGWAVYQSTSDREGTAREAEAHLKRALELSPSADVGHLFMGHLLRDRGEIGPARKEYEKALECNPRCQEAADALSAVAEAGD